MGACCADACDVTLDGSATLTVEIGDTLNQRMLELIAALNGLAAPTMTHEAASGGVLDTFLADYLAQCCP